MPRGKGNPRCAACNGAGIVPAPCGYVVCDCIRGKPNERVVAELAAVKLPSFITYCDEYDRLRQQGVDSDEASERAHAYALNQAQDSEPDQWTRPLTDDDVSRADPVPAYTQGVLPGMPST